MPGIKGPGGVDKRLDFVGAPPSKPAPSPDLSSISKSLFEQQEPLTVQEITKKVEKVETHSVAGEAVIQEVAVQGSKVLGWEEKKKLVAKKYVEIFDECSAHWGMLMPQEQQAIRRIPQNTVLNIIELGLELEEQNSQLFFAGEINFHAVKVAPDDVSFYVIRNNILGAGSFKLVSPQVSLSDTAEQEVLVRTKEPVRTPQEARLELEKDYNILALVNADGKPHRGLTGVPHKVQVLSTEEGEIGYMSVREWVEETCLTAVMEKECFMIFL